MARKIVCTVLTTIVILALATSCGHDADPLLVSNAASVEIPCLVEQYDGRAVYKGSWSPNSQNIIYDETAPEMVDEGALLYYCLWDANERLILNTEHYTLADNSSLEPVVSYIYGTLYFRDYSLEADGKNLVLRSPTEHIEIPCQDRVVQIDSQSVPLYQLQRCCFSVQDGILYILHYSMKNSKDRFFLSSVNLTTKEIDIEILDVDYSDREIATAPDALNSIATPNYFYFFGGHRVYKVSVKDKSVSVVYDLLPENAEYDYHMEHFSRIYYYDDYLILEKIQHDQSPNSERSALVISTSGEFISNIYWDEDIYICFPNLAKGDAE